MAKRATTARKAEETAEIEVNEAPEAIAAKASAKSVYVMKRSGVAEGVSGAVYKFSRGQELITPEGDLDHMGERYCEKK